MAPKALSYDEQKAAEAAFQGTPCNPLWSSSAKSVYEGITRAMSALEEPALVLPKEEIFSHTN
jgi:hypothetical protein